MPSRCSLLKPCCYKHLLKIKANPLLKLEFKHILICFADLRPTTTQTSKANGKKQQGVNAGRREEKRQLPPKLKGMRYRIVQGGKISCFILLLTAIRKMRGEACCG